MKKNLSRANVSSPRKGRGIVQSNRAWPWLLLLQAMICGGVATPSSAQGDAAKKEIAKQIVTKVDALTPTIAFTPNMGQYENKDILYTAKAPFGHYTLTPKGLIMGVYDMESVKAISDYQTRSEDVLTGGTYVGTHTQPSLKGTGIILQYIGANLASMASTTTEGESSDHSNWLMPGKAITNVHSYNIVTYKNLYKGVDVKYYTAKNGNLENDVIIQPGADATQVAMEIKGADAVNVSADGKLQMLTAQGPIEMLPPVSYLKDSAGKLTQIKVAYTNKGGNKIGFDIPAYDKSRTLIIDPVVMRWATLVSTNANVTASHDHGVSLDAAGNIYVTGNIQASTNNALTTVGAYAATAGSTGNQQTFVAKYTEPATVGGAGTRVWQTYLAGDATGTVNVYAINVGPDGFVYICGTTNNTMATTYGTFTPAPTYTNPAFTTGSAMGYIAKVKADGTGAAVRAFKGSPQIGTVTASLILYDLRILPGASSSFSLVVTGPYVGPAAAGDIPALVSPAGVAQTYTSTVSTTSSFSMNITSDLDTKTWTKNIGIAGALPCATLISTVDYANNIYLAGYSFVDGLNYKGATQTNLTGKEDGWLMKLNNAGVVQYSRYLNATTNADSVRIICMELNRAGTHLVTAGFTTGLTSANITGSPYQAAQTGDECFFIQKIPVSGAAPLWGTYLGGTVTVNNMMGLNTDLNDDIYILGYSSPTGYPVTAGRVQDFQNSTETAVFSKIRSDGQALLYSTTMGGTTLEGDPVGERGIQFANCRIYLAVTSESNDFPLTQNAVTTAKLTPVGDLDPILISMANPPDFNTYTVTPATQTIACGSTAASITSTTVTYNVPRIIRNGTVGSTAPTNTTGTATEYPTGYGLASTTYQWQKSLDGGTTWTNITSATSLTYAPGTVVQNANYRILANGDVCVIAAGPTAAVAVTGAPTAAPSVTCSSTVATFTSNAAGTGILSYAWVLPTSSTRGNPGNVSSFALSNVNGNDAGSYTLTVTSTTNCAVTKTFSFNPTTCGITALPIELVSFTANTSGCGVMLNWATASELNNAWFVVERSSDGINYTELQRMRGAVTSTDQHSYNFIDNTVKPLARYYYRLRQIDIDGKATYSNIASTVPWCAAVETVIKAYPIPASNFVNITGLVGPNVFSLVDMNGKKIIDFNSANTIETISLGSLAKGLYILKVMDANGKTTNLKISKD